MAQKKVETVVNKAKETTKKVVDNVKKDPLGAAAGAAKVVVGGVTGAAQTAISLVANSKFLKGTKAGTAVDLSNSLVGLTGAWADVGIDAIKEVASGIYKGKSVSQLEKIILDTAKKSTKGSVDSVIDKSLACLQAYDPSINKQDLANLGKDFKEFFRLKKK